MEKSCFSDKSHFEVHGRKSQYVRRSIGEPLSTFHILQAPKTPQRKCFGVASLLMVVEDYVQAKEWWIQLHTWKFCKKLGSNNAKIILRWKWDFSAGQCTMPHLKKNANIFLKVKINFARLARQLP